MATNTYHHRPMLANQTDSMPVPDLAISHFLISPPTPPSLPDVKQEDRKKFHRTKAI